VSVEPAINMLHYSYNRTAILYNAPLLAPTMDAP
jgi:hypothetical protein